MMKKNTKAMRVRTNIQAGSGDQVGYSNDDCFERCTTTQSEDLCKPACYPPV